MDPIYCYPSTYVLINRFGYKDYMKLNVIERERTSFRLSQLQKDPIKGNFDFTHLKAIHMCLFQDIYSWAGETRIVDISKGNTHFANYLYIIPDADRIFKELKKDNYLVDYNLNKFCEGFSYYAAEINMLHPFREGNGRTIREFLRCLALNANYQIDYSKINKDELYQAFVKSVTDTSDLKKIFLNHINQSIKQAYPEEFIKQASDYFISKLNDIRLNFSKNGEPCSLKEIKSIYKDLGAKAERCIIEFNDPVFKLVSDVVTEMKVMQSHYSNYKIVDPENKLNTKHITEDYKELE